MVVGDTMEAKVRIMTSSSSEFVYSKPFNVATESSVDGTSCTISPGADLRSAVLDSSLSSALAKTRNMVCFLSEFGCCRR